MYGKQRVEENTDSKKEMKNNETRTATVKVRTNSSGIYAIANEAYNLRSQCAAAHGQRKRKKDRERKMRKSIM